MKMARGLIVIDHHLTAKEALQKIPDANKIFDMRQSGATLAWNYFHPRHEIPMFLRYVEDRDLWRNALAQ